MGRLISRIGRVTATSPGILDRPDSADRLDEKDDRGWIVTVFNNDRNSFEEVIHILIVATQCSIDEATMETWEVHNLGKSVVHHSDRQECEQVAAVIAQIGIEVKVSQE